MLHGEFAPCGLTHQSTVGRVEAETAHGGIAHGTHHALPCFNLHDGPLYILPHGIDAGAGGVGIGREQRHEVHVVVERKGIFRIGRNHCASLAPGQEGGIAYGRGEGGGRCGEGCRAARGVGGAYGCRELGGIAVGDVKDKVDGLSVHVVLGIGQAVVGEAQAQAALADAGVCRHGRGELHLLADC